MGTIRRDWLERIPDWAPVPRDDLRPRRVRKQEHGEHGDDPALREDPDGSDAQAGDEDGAPGAQEAGDGGGGEQAAAGRPATGEPEDDLNGEGADEPGESGETPPDFSLDVPAEVEARRHEAEEKRRRSALNRHLAPQAFALEGHYLRNLATRFARMISKVAEDAADMPAQGDEEWDLNELIKRRFTGRLISQCRMTREKRKVAVVLDTSPSCEHQALLFGAIARIAEELGDCELYDAPNFAIVARKLGAQWEGLPATEREWGFKGRVVLAFGDFDGIERICQASAVRGNRIYWFCCEERPAVLESGRETLVKAFKGHYHPATSLTRLMRALRRVR